MFISFSTEKPSRLKNDPDYVPLIFVYSVEISSNIEKLPRSKRLIQCRERHYLQENNASTVEHSTTTVIEHNHKKQDALPAEEEHDKENNDPQAVSSELSEDEPVPSMLSDKESSESTADAGNDIQSL